MIDLNMLAKKAYDYSRLRMYAYVSNNAIADFTKQEIMHNTI